MQKFRPRGPQKKWTRHWGACAQRRPVLQALTRAAAIDPATCSCSTEKKGLANNQKLGGEPRKPQDQQTQIQTYTQIRFEIDQKDHGWIPESLWVDDHPLSWGSMLSAAQCWPWHNWYATAPPPRPTSRCLQRQVPPPNAHHGPVLTAGRCRRPHPAAALTPGAWRVISHHVTHFCLSTVSVAMPGYVTQMRWCLGVPKRFTGMFCQRARLSWIYLVYVIYLWTAQELKSRIRRAQQSSMTQFHQFHQNMAHPFKTHLLHRTLIISNSSKTSSESATVAAKLQVAESTSSWFCFLEMAHDGTSCKDWIHHLAVLIVLVSHVLLRWGNPLRQSPLGTTSGL